MGNFYGIPGIKFISHGETADPEVEYKGYTFNYWDIEDSLYDLFKQEFEPYEDDLYVSKDTGEVLSFEDWLNQNKDLVYSELDDFVAFSKYDYDDIADDDYFDDDGYYNESKRVNERQSDRSFIDYKETDFDNPDIEYTVVVFKYDEKMGKTYYFDNYAEAKEFARDMKNQDNVKDVMIREEEIWGRSDTAEFSASGPLKYNSDDGEWYKSIGRDNHGEMQYKRYGESKNRGKKKVKESVYSFYKSIEELIDGGYESALNYLRAVYLQDITGEPVFYADESDVSNEELIDYFAGTYFVPEDFEGNAGDDWSKVESKNCGRRNIKKINESKSDWYDDLYFSTTDGRGDFTVGNEQNSFNQSYEFDDSNEEIWVCQHHLKCLQKALQNNHIGYTTEKFSGDNDGDCQICDDGENHSTIYCISDFYED